MNSLKCDVELFSRLYIGCQTRDGNLDDFFRHENQACPPSLSATGKLHLGTKSDMLECLEGLSEAQSEAPKVTNVVIDGAVLVQMLKPGAAETFEEYAHQVFIPYISEQFQHVSRLDLVWTSYVVDSLKATARAKRGKGVRRRVVDSAPILANWQNFLRVDLNKKELFSFLSKALFTHSSRTKKNWWLQMGIRLFAYHHNRMHTYLPFAITKRLTVNDAACSTCCTT